MSKKPMSKSYMITGFLSAATRLLCKRMHTAALVVPYKCCKLLPLALRTCVLPLCIRVPCFPSRKAISQMQKKLGLGL